MKKYLLPGLIVLGFVIYSMRDIPVAQEPQAEAPKAIELSGVLTGPVLMEGDRTTGAVFTTFEGEEYELELPGDKAEQLITQWQQKPVRIRGILSTRQGIEDDDNRFIVRVRNPEDIALAIPSL